MPDMRKALLLTCILCGVLLVSGSKSTADSGYTRRLQDSSSMRMALRRPIAVWGSRCLGVTKDVLQHGAETFASIFRKSRPHVNWLSDYAQAMALAEKQSKMLFIYFCDGCPESDCARFRNETLEHPQVKKKLRDYVCVQVPTNAKIKINGQETALLEHESFQEMLGRPGIAIIDYRSRPGSQLRGKIVSMFPITDRLWYTPEQMMVILDLPPGSLTQRTLIYAVKTHPEHPASADSELSPVLLEEAESHSQYQADICVQGHHFWESRFHKINAKLPDGLSAKEVCAESWPGENLVEAAIECVRCWRLSSGHWNAVSSPNSCFGYDMKRGQNGVWYATGIFGSRYY